mmetsp:Transcript_17288/g.37863  ORF Transcript_17288/g.37863 Transcript_17288/m.37863 type:complete len:336 (-) Transcript_17288:50-1057(-)
MLKTLSFCFALAVNIVSSGADTDLQPSNLVLFQVQTSLVLGSNETHKPANSAKQPPQPMMIMQRGCTCSSTVMQYTRSLFDAIGEPLYNLQVKELLRPVHMDQNPWFQEGEDVATMLQRSLNATVEQGLGLLFNNFKVSQSDNMKAVNEVLISHGTRTVIVHRQNSLDTLICEVRDCFKGNHQPPRGYPVDLEGKPNDLCFLRRGADGGGVKTKAVIDTQHMMHHLAEAEAYAKRQQAMLKTVGFQDASVVTVEDLLAHEYSKSKLKTSYKAWMTLLRSLGITPKRRKVADFLKERIGTYSPPEPHTESVWNVDEVVDALKKNGKQELWRSVTEE